MVLLHAIKHGEGYASSGAKVALYEHPGSG